jgi:hypothetical protein
MPSPFVVTTRALLLFVDTQSHIREIPAGLAGWLVIGRTVPPFGWEDQLQVSTFSRRVNSGGESAGTPLSPTPAPCVVSGFVIGYRHLLDSEREALDLVSHILAG